jgi:NADPH-dependent 2,4-dienoyl-CoA reductase/sulfur reductase-like enzyme
MTRLVVIGGSDAGVEAALAARRVDAHLEIEILLEDRYLNYSICGLPYLVSGEVPGWQRLAHRSSDEIESLGIQVRREHRVTDVDLDSRALEVDSPDGRASIPFDRLVFATGAGPSLPAAIPKDDPATRPIHTIDDGIAMRRYVESRRPHDAAVIGSGYIGVEMADALVRQGVDVTMFGRAPTVLPTFSADSGALVEAELRENGVAVMTGEAVGAVRRNGTRLSITSSTVRNLDVDLAVIATGVRPTAELARQAGLEIGSTGAVVVDREMRTNVSGIFAAGDCVETYHAILERPAYLPLGTTAHKQGRIAGTNAAGGAARFAGSVGTQVVKVFDLAAGRTGLSEAEALAAGFPAATVRVVAPDHKPYYPGSRDLEIAIVGDIETGRFLGAEIVGDWRAGVAKRIDLFAVAAQHGWATRELLDADLSYTPPLGSPWDPVQVAADAWVRSTRPVTV